MNFMKVDFIAHQHLTCITTLLPACLYVCLMHKDLIAFNFATILYLYMYSEAFAVCDNVSHCSCTINLNFLKGSRVHILNAN